MGTIVISQNLSLDGVVQDPTGEEGYKFGGWFGQVGERDREEWAKVELDEVLRAEALLLGRRSDAWFAERWLSRTGVWADRLNSMPKYVVSSTIERPRWTNSTNSTVLKGDVVGEVSKLKQEIDGEIVVFASNQLVHTLVEHDLVDQLRLMVYPVVAGAGKRLFEEIRSGCGSSAPGRSVTISPHSRTTSPAAPTDLAGAVARGTPRYRRPGTRGRRCR
jgi:dihydrofolate reductase